MRKPKPPSPRSVSATLRTAGFHAIGDGDEGYEVSWHHSDPASGAVWAAFHSFSGDGSAAAHQEAGELEAKALAAMAVTLRHKGWLVEENPGYLIVRELREMQG